VNIYCDKNLSKHLNYVKIYFKQGIYSDYRQFPDIYFLQGSVAMCMRFGWFCDSHFFHYCLLPSLKMKEF